MPRSESYETPSNFPGADEVLQLPITATPIITKSRGEERYMYDLERPQVPADRRPLIIPQSYIVNDTKGVDSVAAWSTPITIAAGAPRKPPLLNTMQDDLEFHGIELSERPRSSASPFANNQRQKVENPAYKAIAAERRKRKQRRKHIDCVGILFFLTLTLGSMAAYGFGLYETKFWQSDTSDAPFHIPGYAHGLIIAGIMGEMMLLIGFVARWYKSYER